MKLSWCALGMAALLVACADDSAGTASTGSGSGEGAGGCFAAFDGVDDGLFLVPGSELGKSTGFSVSAFVQPDALADGAVAFVAGRHLDGSSNGYYLALAREGGKDYARFIAFPGGSTCAASGEISLSAGQPLHLLGSMDGTVARVFADGNQVAELECGGAPVIESTSIFTIGRSESNVFPFAGRIDDVAYYNRATNASFAAGELGCDGAAFRFSFDSAPIGDSVSSDCGSALVATIGTDPGMDAADPTFACP